MSESNRTSRVVSEILQFVDVPVYVGIRRRDQDGVPTEDALVPVGYIKPNYDGNGVVIWVEEKDIVFNEAKR